jgi:raffinose/stachyose/melibiose transport system permease protein
MGNMRRLSVRRNQRGSGSVFTYLALTLLVIFALGPIIVLVFNSLKTNVDLGQRPLGPPFDPQWLNYANAWLQGNFATTMRNSLIYVTFTVIGVLVLGGMAAYSLARLQPRGSSGYMIYMLTLSTLPFWMYVIPLFIMWRNLGFLNTYHGLILIYIAGNSPFAIFLLRSYMLNLPPDFEDAARVDGANELQVATKVVLPMMWPGFLTVGLVVALSVWNEFQAALIFVNDDDKLPVTTSYYNFTQRFGQDWALTSAGAVMMIAPVLIIFLILQRRFVEGLTQGGLKM